MVSSNVLLDSIQIEIGGENEWPDDAKLFQPYETEQILMPDSANCLAVQAFLQMANLKYETVYKANAAEMSPTGRVPFIKVGQYLVAELEPIVAFVQNKNISLTVNLTDAEKSDMRAYMSLINTVFGNAENYVTWCDSETYNKVTKKRFGSIHPFPLNHILLWKKRSATIERMKALGGKTEQEAVLDDVDLCCQSLSDRLGDRDFFFKSGPTELDCLLYAHVNTILNWPHLCAGNLLAQTICKYPKLVCHCIAMKKHVCLEKSDVFRVYGPLITIYNNISSTSKKKQIFAKSSLCHDCKDIVASERKSKDGQAPVIFYDNSIDSVKSESCTSSSLETSDSDMQSYCQRCGARSRANEESSRDATAVPCSEKKCSGKKVLDSKPKQAVHIRVKENKNNKNASFEVRETCTKEQSASDLSFENESSAPSCSTSQRESHHLYSASKNGTLGRFDSLTLMNCPQLFSICGSIMDAIRIGSSKTVTTNNASSHQEKNCRSLPMLTETGSKSAESCDDPSLDEDDSVSKVCIKTEKVNVKLHNNEADQKPCVKICRASNGESSSTNDASVPSRSSKNCSPNVPTKMKNLATRTNDSSVCKMPKTKVGASYYNNSKERNLTTRCCIPTPNYKRDNYMPDKNVALSSGKQDASRTQRSKTKNLRSSSLGKCLDRAQRKKTQKTEDVVPKFQCKREGTFSVLDYRPSIAHSSVSSYDFKREFKKEERCALSNGKTRSNNESPGQDECERSKLGSGTNLTFKKENSMPVNQTSSCSLNFPESKCGFAQILGMVRDSAFPKKAGNSCTTFNPALIKEEPDTLSLADDSEDPPSLQIASKEDLPRNLMVKDSVVSCELQLPGIDNETRQSENVVLGMCDTEDNTHKKATAKMTNIPVPVKNKLKDLSDVSPRVNSKSGGKTCEVLKKIPSKDIEIRSVSYSKLNVKHKRDVYSRPSPLKDVNIKSSSPSKLSMGSERISKLCPVPSEDIKTKNSSPSKLNIKLERNSNLCVTPSKDIKFKSSAPFKLTIKQEKNLDVCPTPSKKIKSKNSSCSVLDVNPKKDLDLCRASSKECKKSSPSTAVKQNSDDETCLDVEAQVDTSDLGAETNCIAFPVKKLSAATLPPKASKKSGDNSCQIVTKTRVFSSDGKDAKQFVKTDVTPYEDKSQNREVGHAEVSHAKPDTCDLNSIFTKENDKNTSAAESTLCELGSISSEVLKALPADDSNSECNSAVQIEKKPVSSNNMKLSDKADLKSETSLLYPYVEPPPNKICSRRRSASEKCLKSDSLSVTLSCSDEALVSTSEAKLTGVCSISKISVRQNLGEQLNIAVSENLDEQNVDKKISTPVIHLFENQKAKSNKHAEDNK